MEIVWYFVQVSCCVSVFYILYAIFFRNNTFFNLNRTYLLFGLIFSFVIPVLEFSAVPIDYHMTASEVMTDSAISGSDIFFTNMENYTSGGSAVELIPILYWIGFTFMMSRLLISIARLLRIKSNAAIHWYGKVKTWRTDTVQPFSFLNRIFLPTHDVNSLIIEHEIAHVKLRHGWDSILLEVAGALLWFNPVLIFYRRALKTQHEYEADAHVLRRGGSLEEYLQCMVGHLYTSNLSGPISQFDTPNIKTRILMMTKKKTSRKFSLLDLLCIPIGCILLFAFSDSHRSSNELSRISDLTPDESVVIIVDAGHGGEDAGVKGNGGASEKEVAIAIAKNIQREGEANHIKVILTRNADEALSLNERVMASGRHHAAAFISIHTNFNEDISARGIACIVSENNAQFAESKQLADNLVQAFQDLTGISVNGVQKSNFVVLRENTVPAILVELGYLSNPSDYQYVTDPENQQQISKRIIAAVKKYVK